MSGPTTSGPVPTAWRAALRTLLVLWLALLALYAGSFADMVAIWLRSGTYAHCVLVPPIALWLGWRERARLLAAPPRPTWLPLLLLPLPGLLWVVAGLAHVGVAQQYAAVATLPLAAWAVLGHRAARTLAFPMAFLFLAVPFGESFVPGLMQFTADFTVTALRLTGVPVYREGLNFALPTGNWSVVEACSGLRYLIASFTVGCLYAWLMYRHLSRRVVFVALALAVPILANGLRAYLIVLLGHWSDMTLAVGVDHFIYGWVFFALVIGALFWAGAFWREDPPPMPRTRHPRADTARIGGVLPAVALATATLAALPPLAGHWLDAPASLSNPHIAVPAAPPEWQALAPADTLPPAWEPDFRRAEASLRRTYRDSSGDVFLRAYLYGAATRGSGGLSSDNVLASTDNPRWRQTGEFGTSLHGSGHYVHAREARIAGRGGQFVAVTWYWAEGVFSGNPYRVKLAQAWSRLQGGPGRMAILTVFAPYEETPAPAATQGMSAPLPLAAQQARLRRFAEAMLPALAASLNEAGAP